MARRNARRYDSEDLNPMNYVSNLSDVMLIFAVGIMLALILHWEVPVGDIQDRQARQNEQNVITFSDDDLDAEEEIPEDMDQVGNVYYDEETGKYYIIRE